jgi:glycosyltransferase involved in cell wall biosynthesis
MSPAGSESRRRVLYVQYTNPAAYPPLVHSARLLADTGWEVLLLGTSILSDTLTMDAHSRIESELLPHVAGGWQQKAHYLRFTTRAVKRARRWRPDWIYASDPLACPVALLLATSLRTPLLYHEHDSPEQRSSHASLFMRAALAARAEVARRAAICVLPSADRAALFKSAHPRARVSTVWNCPSVEEVAPTPRRPSSTALRVLYHGSIVPARLPLSVIDALSRLPAGVTLSIVGYETAGHVGYVDALRRRARELGVSERIEVVGALSRRHLMRHCATCDVGLALMPLESTDVNEQMMLGASNKPFDYMAGGLPVIVSTLPGWQQTFVDGGFGVACVPNSADSLTSVLRRLLEDCAARAAMGEKGRLKIKTDWNYERVFAPVLQRMNAAGGGAAVYAATDQASAATPS